MAKKKSKKKVPVLPQVVQQPMPVAEVESELFDLSNPDEFRKAFIASEILGRKYF